MIRSRSVAPRARWIADIVDSVPEFEKRHWGRPKRWTRFSAETIEPLVGAAKWVPSSWRALTASPITGLACPTHITPKPLWKSTYSVPSTSQTSAPLPRSMYTGHGSLSWKEEGTPPGITLRARSKYSAEVGVCSRKRAICSSVSLLITFRSMVDSASVARWAIRLGAYRGGAREQADETSKMP